jgi:TonB family protein
VDNNQDHLRFRRRAIPTAGSAAPKSKFGIILSIATAVVIIPAMIYGFMHPDKVGSTVKQIARHVSLPVKDLHVAIIATRSTPTPQPSATPTPAPAATPGKHGSKPQTVLTAHEAHLKRLHALLAASAHVRKIASTGQSSDVASAGSSGTGDSATTQTTNGAGQDTTAGLTSTQATAAPTPATVAVAQAPDADATPVYAPDVVVDARFTRQVQPEYPPIARDQGVQGTAIVLATIGPDGKVISAHIDQSTGDRMLDAAALDAARQSGFEPPIINGKPATETYRLVYNFSL